MQADFTIITDHNSHSATAIRNNAGWDLVREDFYGGAYISDAIRWLKKQDPTANFELLTVEEWRKRG